MAAPSRSWPSSLARALIIVAIAALPAACGGGGGASSSGSSNGEAASGGGEPEGDVTEGGTRNAAQGAPCDHGGASDRTCRRGFYCCYGPPDDPGEHGTCQPDCEG